MGAAELSLQTYQTQATKNQISGQCLSLADTNATVLPPLLINRIGAAVVKKRESRLLIRFVLTLAPLVLSDTMAVCTDNLAFRNLTLYILYTPVAKATADVESFFAVHVIKVHHIVWKSMVAIGTGNVFR